MNHFKISLSISPELWHAFRKACLDRHTPASEEVRRLISHQLRQWEHGEIRQEQKDDLNHGYEWLSKGDTA